MSKRATAITIRATANRQQTMEEAVTLQIAIEKLGLSTLDERGLDALDFHELNVHQIRAALVAAFRRGQVLGAI